MGLTRGKAFFLFSHRRSFAPQFRNAPRVQTAPSVASAVTTTRGRMPLAAVVQALEALQAPGCMARMLAIGPQTKGSKLFTHTHIHTYTDTQIHRYSDIQILRYTHTYIHTYIHPYIHTSIHPYIHTSIHPYIHTFMLSAIQANSCKPVFF